MHNERSPSPTLVELLDRERLPRSVLETIASVYEPLAVHIAAGASSRGKPSVVGLCGPQGSGKSTVASILRELLAARGLSAAVVSLDDFYLTRSERRELADRIHPLLATRGVPGTHDVALAERTFDALGRTGPVALPSFDKASDDRRAQSEWITVTAPMDIVIFEGWCVGARPQSEAALREPINDLERECDPNGLWRTYVNERLREHYARLFARIDELVLLQAPTFDVVYQWRAEQERKLRGRAQHAGGDISRVMSETELRRFIAHYERLTRHVMSEMPARADVVIELNESRRVERARARGTRLPGT
jgi:D-glycerate 3-kinase